MGVQGLRKVVWAEGVFLGQQHFQAWDAYQEKIQSLRTKIYEPHFWGVKDVSWDKAALENGRLVLTQCLAVLPNGQIIDYDRNRDTPVHLELGDLSRLELDVQLTIADSDNVDTITGYNAQGNAAWNSEYVDVADCFDSNRKREVLLAQPNLNLIESGTQSNRVISLNIARLKKDMGGSYTLDSDYIPPLVSVHAAGGLMNSLRSLTELLTVRFKEINARRTNVSDVGSYTPSEMADFLFVSDISDILSELRIVEQNPSASSLQLYSTLCRAHDKLALHTQPDKVPYTQPYQHDNLSTTFSELYGAIRDIFGLSNVRMEASIQFNMKAPGLYESSVINSASLENCDFYLAVYLERSDSSWVDQLPSLVKLSSPSDIQNLVASGMSGLPLQHIQRVPSKIRIKSGYEYFLIDKRSALWERVQSTKKISGILFGEFADADVELIPIDE
ncbi:type VI secretion system baseplate subunit TssK [Marinomonas mediterranea]|uniref:type VI secretion system baseplate subunit TssK n=1 Tax=Marinomonas mediterranea TaxID=119864 RepID=UPI00234AD75A|nr:type VI secretion system baseplate subunit TssK [Marinomonas mediterranea]WCN10821.1 type VI secretion system baseplate subunit TssK [Marinomonas mediterranea]